MELHTIDVSCRGPTATSHWVIRNRLLSSAYPGAKDPDEHRCITRSIYDSGIEVFVNLMQSIELARFTPYESDIREYASQDDRRVEFLSFPIPDQFICRDDDKVLEFCLNLSRRIQDDHQKVLLHCWDGHGRTGTIMSILIEILFHFEADHAIHYNYQLHQQRERIKGRTSSLSSRQCEQVRKVLDMHKDQRTSSIT